jgi:hypothetical protein
VVIGRNAFYSHDTSMNLGLLKLSEGFTIDSLPYISCPTCESDYLVIEDKSMRTTFAAESIKNSNHPDWDPTWDFGYFSLTLICRNQKCITVHACSGNFSVDDNLNQASNEPPFITSYQCKYLNPSVPILSNMLPTDTPEQVIARIKEAEQILLTDPNAAANRFRLAIEEVMNEYGINRFQIQKHKRVRLTTHARLLEFKKYEYSIVDAFMAVKWIGNQGSHEDTLSVGDLLTAAEILKFGLEALYGGSEAEMVRNIKSILKQKGVKGSGKKKAK